MSREQDFIRLLRDIVHHPAARGLADDAAVLPMGACDLVLTHDMLVEGVHYLPGDAPADVAWKLVAVNLSDLAAKGARPVGVLLGYMLATDAEWDAAFVAGLHAALGRYDTPLLGGDTVAGSGGPRAFGLTAIGSVPPGQAPSRAGARAGDDLWVTGTIGGAGLGLALAKAGLVAPEHLLLAYRRPLPRLAEGQALAPHVHAMADVSDGLLIDTARMAQASGVAVAIRLDAVPLPPGSPRERTDRLRAATAGDDYELLFAAAASFSPPPGVMCTRIGAFGEGSGITLHDAGEDVPLPATLGFEHG